MKLLLNINNVATMTHFILLRGHFCTNLREILAPGLKLILPATLFYKKKFISTNRSRVNDPPILAQKQPKMAIFKEKKLTFVA